MVRVGNHSSNTIIVSTGVPHDCVLSPLLYSLYTNDCVAKHSLNFIVKFSDDTVFLGLISNNNEEAYMDEVEKLATWCQVRSVSLNVSKARELVLARE